MTSEQSHACEEFASFVGQNHVARFSALAGADRDCAGISIEVFGHEIRQLVEPASGQQGRCYEQSKICMTCVDEPTSLIVGQVPKASGSLPSGTL